MSINVEMYADHQNVVFAGKSVSVFAKFTDDDGFPANVSSLHFIVRRPDTGLMLKFRTQDLDYVSPGIWKMNVVLDAVGIWWFRMECWTPAESRQEMQIETVATTARTEQFGSPVNSQGSVD